jgi:DNA polymerase-3 subunit delta'
MPPTLDDIFDQQTAVAWLRRSVAADRLPHALLFAGPVGVGKATTAAALSSLWLCENPDIPAARPCGRCDSCRALQHTAHPDYHIITRELIRYHDKTGKSKGVDLSINVIRPEVVEKASRKPVMGRGKVFVIEQAETMNAPAQNALLKTLEEPPGRSLIILLTDAPGLLLPTIRSRCQMVTFAPLPRATVLRELAERGIAPAAAQEAAALAAGSLGEALRWIDDGVLTPARELTQQIDAALTGRGPADLPEALKSAGDAYAQAQLRRDELASKDQATRAGLGLHLRLMAEHVRLSLASTLNPLDVERACSAIEAMAKAEENLEANVSVRLVFQQLAATLERRVP